MFLYEGSFGGGNKSTVSKRTEGEPAISPPVRSWRAWLHASPHRPAEASVTTQSCIVLLSPTFTTDDAWAAKYPNKQGEPQQVPYLVREVPKALLYVLGKYGPASNGIITQRLLRIRVQEQADCAQEKAVILIDQAVAMGIISNRVGTDARYGVYYFTVEQIAKLHELDDLEIEARLLAREQAKRPSDERAGMTQQNGSWYRNALHFLRRRDDTYWDIVGWLGKLTYLSILLVAVAIALIILTDPGSATSSTGKT